MVDEPDWTLAREWNTWVEVERLAADADRLAIVIEVVVAKTGTWGPIFADAGIVRASDGRALVIAAFLESVPGYRGSFIADLTERLVRARLVDDAKKP